MTYVHDTTCRRLLIHRCCPPYRTAVVRRLPNVADAGPATNLGDRNNSRDRLRCFTPPLSIAIRTQFMTIGACNDGGDTFRPKVVLTDGAAHLRNASISRGKSHSCFTRVVRCMLHLLASHEIFHQVKTFHFFLTSFFGRRYKASQARRSLRENRRTTRVTNRETVAFFFAMKYLWLAGSFNPIWLEHHLCFTRWYSL